MNLLFKYGKYWERIKSVRCETCEREFTLYKAYRKYKGEYLPVKYTPRCPDCQTEYSEAYREIPNQTNQPSLSPLKPQNMKKTLKSKLKPKRAKKSLKPKALKKKPTKPTITLTPKRTIKSPLDYYECMKACCLKGQKITQTARECKQNALVINSSLSIQKKKTAQKIRSGYRQMGIGLAEFIKASK